LECGGTTPLFQSLQVDAPSDRRDVSPHSKSLRYEPDIVQNAPKLIEIFK
jgi:hypothetical protein